MSVTLYRRIMAIISRDASFTFKAGLFLLFINPVIGLVVSPLLVMIFTRIYDLKTGVLIGTLVYTFSWGLLGLGVLFSGKNGYRISKQIFSEIRGAFKRKKKPED